MTRRNPPPTESISDSDDDSLSTDSEMDYQLDIDNATTLASALLNAKGVQDVYRTQRGTCRITGLPFGEGMYACKAVARCVTKEMTDGNVILVLDVVARMREATGLPWRAFVQLVENLSKEISI